jgi:hypothetical protein
MADLWDEISPDVFRRVIEILADHGRGVSILPIPEGRPDEREGDE